MLLNLARLDNGAPPSFLAVGAVQSNFTFNSTASGGFAPSSTSTHVNSNTTPLSSNSGILGPLLQVASRTATLVLGGNANLGTSFNSNPEFQWIPLNSEQVAKQVLVPMDPNIFYSLYQQGFPIDELLRVMVERVETTLPGAHGVQLVLINSPTRTNVQPTDPRGDSYDRFLRACAMLRIMQMNGDLVLETGSNFQSMAVFTKAAKQSMKGEDDEDDGGGSSRSAPDVSGSADDVMGTPNLARGRHSKDPSDPPAHRIPAPYSPEADFQPTPEEVFQADQNGFRWVKDAGGTWELGKEVAVPKFYLRNVSIADVSRRIQQFRIHGQPLQIDKTAITNLLGLLSTNGITVETTALKHDSQTTCLILRSFSRALEATASEQEAFDELMKYQNFQDIVTPLEAQPVLRTRWDGQPGPLEKPLVKLLYDGKLYQITDPHRSALAQPSGTWNRDVYRLIMELNSQVTVDISKFQRQVLELQSQ